ncbi:hypothetical protein C472_00339 [Halorubrum tebenquichense DSM 14210]|uniref:Uncharacterized protein n=1 Tax=Halorubrum tebenquichense DSM 14210 TaxID=1227485 RepID=M0E222_9EURY|nr:hypothetical protein C472_00339 [Halorubrum tebenquichense DSM 14210]
MAVFRMWALKLDVGVGPLGTDLLFETPIGTLTVELNESLREGDGLSTLVDVALTSTEATVAVTSTMIVSEVSGNERTVAALVFTDDVHWLVAF